MRIQLPKNFAGIALFEVNSQHQAIRNEIVFSPGVTTISVNEKRLIESGNVVIDNKSGRAIKNADKAIYENSDTTVRYWIEPNQEVTSGICLVVGTYLDYRRIKDSFDIGGS